MAQPKINITKVAHLKGHKDAVYDFAIDSKNRVIYSAGADGYIVKWQPGLTEDGTLVLQTDESFYSIHFDPGSGLLYGGTSSGKLYIIDTQQAVLKEIKIVSKHEIFALASREHRLYIGTGKGILFVLHGDELESYQVSQENLRSIHIGDGRLFIGSSDHRIYILETSTLQLSNTLVGHEHSVFALAELDSEHLVSGGRDAHIRLWDTRGYIELESVPAHLYQIKSLAANSRLLLSSSMDKTIKVWNHDLDLLKVIDEARNAGHTNCINRLMWLDERMFVSSSDDKSLIVWQVEINS